MYSILSMLQLTVLQLQRVFFIWFQPTKTNLKLNEVKKTVERCCAELKILKQRQDHKREVLAQHEAQIEWGADLLKRLS